MAMPHGSLALSREVANENFRDRRLTRRLEKLVTAAGLSPDASFPQMFSDPSELEAAYRFYSNVFVTPELILKPHVEATKRRAAEVATLRILHDMTEFSYRRDGKREGFDEERAYQSFAGHFSLAVADDSLRTPLGIAAVHTWPKGKNTAPEQSFWLTQILASERALDAHGRAVHVCDRGADDYRLLHDLLSNDCRFVLRSSVDRLTRNADGIAERMRAVLAKMDHVEERSAWINRRRRETSSHRAKIHPEREPRTVQLHVAAATLELLRPDTKGLKNVPDALVVNVVRVWEPDPPEGATPIEWYLFTSEPIDTPEQVAAIVDHYRARWTIEEYFKALKTGCAFETRQLQDYESLVNALAVFIPIACQMLLVRTIARAEPTAPAARVIGDVELEVLRALGPRKLPASPTARDVMRAIAGLGGHIPYAPDPGWLTLARGYEQLALLTRGWLAAKLQPHSDQR